uniref:Uncharacterized LOC107569759 n=1 Tax=Sinocyclocheilus grahami TaxID=75366 RepID=A0A672T9W9_SINGR
MSIYIFSKGDKLQMISSTVRHPSTEKAQSEATQCNKKMLKCMRFSLSMEDTELGALQEPEHPQPEQKEKDMEDNCFVDDDVLRSLANMSLNLMVDQDFDADNPFCNGDWQLNEGKIVAETQNNLFLKTLKGCNYVASKQNEICLEKTMSVTKICLLCSNIVLHFLCNQSSCSTSTANQLFLCLFQAYDRTNIHISADDPEKSSLIFYMAQKCDGLRYFESALHRGWFIHTVNDVVVKMKRGNNTSSSCFVLE